MYYSLSSLISLTVFTGLSIALSLNADIVFTSGPPNQQDALNMSELIVADNFQLSSAQTLTAATFWTSADVDPFTSQFSGSVGWSVLNDNAGTPGNLIASGVESNSLTLFDTGVTILGTREWTISLALPSLALPSGTYWLGLHESAFGTPDDGSDIYWDTTSSRSAYPAMVTADLSGATGWIQGDGNNLAFQLLGSDTSILPSNSPEPGMLLPVGLLLSLTLLVQNKYLALNELAVRQDIEEDQTVQINAVLTLRPGELSQ